MSGVYHILLPPPLGETVQQFLASPEFQARNTTNTEFVTLLYWVFLNRAPDTGGSPAGWPSLTAGPPPRISLWCSSPHRG